MQGISNVLPELWMGLASLLAHKLRSLLTMLGMIFGVGAVVASMLPWLLANVFDVSNVAEPGQLPDSVRFAFYLGAAAFLGKTHFHDDSFLDVVSKVLAGKS